MERSPPSDTRHNPVNNKLLPIRTQRRIWKRTHSSALLSAWTIPTTSFRRATTSSLSLSRSSSTSGLYSSCKSSRWRFSFEWFTRVSVIALGTMSIISRFTMLKYEWMSSSAKVGQRRLVIGSDKRTDDFSLERFALIQRSLRANYLGWLHSHRDAQSTCHRHMRECKYRLHRLRALLRLLLLALG
jgi:hypothetical protein